MKIINFSQGLFLLGASLLLVLLTVTSSCKKDSSSPSKNEVYIENMAFSPATITVPLNTTVTWTNMDGTAHTVTSTMGVFDSGSIADNGTFSYTFTTAGSYNYECTFHPSMTGTVVVSSN